MLEIGIVVDDVGRLSSEFESDLLQVGLGGSGHDLTTNSGRTSEGDLLDLEVGRDGGTDSVSVSSDDIDDTRGEDLSDERASESGRQRGRLGGLRNSTSLSSRAKSPRSQRERETHLHDDRVTHSESGTELPREHEEREVP